ncbi:hypothetical protein R3P38DRAFT_788975 [Favolaschia claudopus]|uniref:Uncharacterized protein n=1 Tax=Favolaschia claudopus TaxID=2862362 RepID=A0AAW0C297_9AGAR
MHAFEAVLSHKPARYSSLLKMLRSFLAHPLHRRYLRRFKALTAQGFADLTPIDF